MTSTRRVPGESPPPESTRLLQEKDRRTLVMPGARLLVLRGPDKGRAIRIEGEETVVGTGKTADLQLTDGTVSRSHLVLRVTPLGYLVVDIGSTNGTWIDERRIESTYVEIGDRISLGETQIRLEAQRQPVELPLSGANSFGRLLGWSVAARRLFALLEKVAPQDTSVLLLGETGTGKDIAAGSIHEASGRRNGPFVVIDCAALVGELMESELFGHEKGAFTDAHAQRIGAFAEANGGTLFLDEIGELPRPLQSKLLRALGNREVRPVGSARTRTVDVRIIAATNRDLKLDVNRGLFREDLFHRLNVVSVRLPPLRERPEDIAPLAQHFWRQQTRDAEGTLPDGLVAELIAHNWPGNVRELRNRIERLAVTEERTPKEPTTVESPPESFRRAKAAAIAAFERAFVIELLGRANGNVSEAARLAAMDRVYLSKLIRRYAIGRAR